MTAAKVSRIPANAPEPQDHRPKKASVAARQAEAEDGFITVELRGVTLQLPLVGHVPLKAIERFRVGDNYGGTKEMIGEEQWDLLLNAGATDGDLDELAEKLNEARGN